ncbi:hypothetical protein N665_0813s0007 [Sinapis alba]|nr:hypothetical protein N665_0813s0007 [Sinapis alba]
MAKNRFLCEVCNKGFNREQNLELHRRVHNLSWKLKQKSKKEVRRKVYICPEPTCVHHDPSQALRNLTGIKKHYYRKHSEKQWKCEKCPKSYALQSDWKTHSKICGTKEYRCDCDTIFSRRDNYNTHKKFCNALNQDSGRSPTVSFTEMAADAGGSGGRHDFCGGAASALGRQDFYGSSASVLGRQDFYGGGPSALGRHGFYGGAASALSNNQGLLAHNDQTLRSQHDLISLSDKINNNNNSTNLGYFQNNTKNSNQALFTHGADNNDPSALLRGLTSSSSSFSSVVFNGFGQNQNGNLQDLMMNSLPVTKTQQGWSGSNIFTPHFGNNLSMGGCVSNGRNPAPLDTEMKFSYPNHPFGHP